MNDILSNLPFIDFIFILLIAVCAIAASFKGFIDEIFDKGAPVLGICAGFFFYKKLSSVLIQYVKIEMLSNVFGFILVFIFVFLIIKIIQQLIGELFNAKIFRQLDHTLGFFFGIVEGFALVAIIIFLMNLQPWFDVSGTLNNSFFISYIIYLFRKKI